MGKLLNSLKYQLKTKYKEDAQECLKVYNYLLESTGYIWQSQWDNLVNTDFIGDYPNSKRISKLNFIGKTFLKGLKT